MHPTNGSNKFVSTDQIILGFGLGVSLIIWAMTSGHVITSAIGETLFTALYLTMVVGWSKFKLPTFFAASNPRLAAFTMAFFCGVISLFFDSFAVILLLSSMTLKEFKGRSYGGYSAAFKKHAYKVSCAFNALTFGGAFYIGELWGLPYYIKCGMNTPSAGWPLLLAVLPTSLIVSAVAAYFFPVKIEPVKFDKTQMVAAAKIVPFLVLIILTHDPVLCLGVLLVVSALFKQTGQLVRDTIHEISSGAEHALGLITIAFVIQQIGGAAAWFEVAMGGPVMALWAALSSPFTGAMAPVAETIGEFYLNLSYIMFGSPVLVSSSLVAIVVFKESLKYEDLPASLQAVQRAIMSVLPSKGGAVDEDHPAMSEMVSYTFVCMPFLVVLGVFIAIAHFSGGYVAVADLLGIEMIVDAAAHSGGHH